MHRSRPEADRDDDTLRASPSDEELHLVLDDIRPAAGGGDIMPATSGQTARGIARRIIDERRSPEVEATVTYTNTELLESVRAGQRELEAELGLTAGALGRIQRRDP